MKEFILRSTDFQIRETKEGQEFVALDWRVANSKEFKEEVKACGVEKYVVRTAKGDDLGENSENEVIQID